MPIFPGFTRPTPAPTRSLRTRFVAAALLAAAVTLSACSDNVTAPSPAFPDTMHVSPATFANRVIDFGKLYPDMDWRLPTVSSRGDTTVETFKVDPQDGKRIEFGENSGNIIAFPPNTLCDPYKNSYGPSEWKKPCILATNEVKFEVRTWRDSNGIPHAEFLPKIRFNPSAIRPVTLYFRAPRLTMFNSVFIPYCNAVNVCINESIGDPELETYTSPLAGGGYWVYRTLRHFSGYTVAAD